MATKRKTLRNTPAPDVTNRKRQRSVAEPESTAAKLRKILERVDQLPTLDHRSVDEILPFDEYGVPR